MNILFSLLLPSFSPHLSCRQHPVACHLLSFPLAYCLGAKNGCCPFFSLHHWLSTITRDGEEGFTFLNNLTEQKR